jgi:two-component system, NtrC family, response regulator HupR/HoxA
MPSPLNSVLIVDDEALVREMLMRVLNGAHYTTYQAASADDALGILATTPIAVMLCDRRMPGKDGDWLIQQTRERFPDVALILITGDDAVPPRVALQIGVVGYLVKPFTVDAVRDAVRDAMVWHQVAARTKHS